MAVVSDSYISTPPTGWTLNSNSTNATFFGQYVYTKIAAGGESSWNVTMNVAACLTWVVFEVAGAEGSPFDGAAAQYVQSSGSTYTSANLTPTAGERLLIAVFAGSLNGTTLQGVTDWTNAFVEVADGWTKKVSGVNDTVGVASRVVLADGTTSYNTGVTYANSASPQARGAIMLSLKGLTGANLAPTANAGANQTVPSNVHVALDGSASFDGEGTVASYSWQQLAGTPVTLSSNTAAAPVFTSPTGATVLSFGLTVTDNDGASSSQDVVHVTVTGVPGTTALIRVGGAWVQKPMAVRKNGVWKAN
jgi:hypothetical protein